MEVCHLLHQWLLGDMALSPISQAQRRALSASSGAHCGPLLPNHIIHLIQRSIRVPVRFPRAGFIWGVRYKIWPSYLVALGR